MVSGFVTSPDDQSRICFDDASPIRIASKSLMSIKALSSLFPSVVPGRQPSLFDFYVRELDLAHRPQLGLGLFLGLLGRRQLDVVEVAQRLVGRQGQLSRLVDALLALLGLLGR